MIDPPGSQAARAQQKLAALWHAFAAGADMRIRFEPGEMMSQYDGLVSQHGLVVAAFSTDAWRLVEICFNVVPRNPDFDLPRYWEFEGDIEAAEADSVRVK